MFSGTLHIVQLTYSGMRLYQNNNKKTIDFNFDFYQAFKHHGYTKTWEQQETVN